MALRSQRVDGNLLGSTELPVLLEEEGTPDLLNRAPYLAEAALRYALEMNVSTG